MIKDYFNLIKAAPTYISAKSFLKKSQWWDANKIEEFQIKKLKKLIEYSYRNVPYYHNVMKEKNLTPEDIRSVDDLLKLPVLSKQEINEYYGKLISKIISPSKLLPYSTSGSTGEPTKFIHDWNSLPWIEAANNRFFSWAGKTSFSKMISISPPRAGVVKNARKIMREKSLTIFGGDDENILKVIHNLKREKPSGIKGYASSLAYLANFMVKTDVQDINIDFVISSSELLTESMRKLIEKAFHCEVFDNYGSREFAIGGECEEHNGFHIAAENLLVEFVDSNKNKHVDDGETGEIIITDLTRFGMPLIRYRIGDVGVPSNLRCACGRGLPLIEKLEGRVTEMLVTSDGKHLPGVAIVTMIFKDLNVRQFRVIQKNRSSLTIKIVKGEGFSQKDIDFIIKNFQELDKNLLIEFEFPEEIPKTQIGKNVLVQSLIRNY